MKSLVVIFTILTFSFIGFSQQTINGSIVHDGLQREYILYVPENYTGDFPVPLVLNFHGYGSNASEQMWYGDFRSIADSAGFLLIHPQGTLFNGVTHWNVGGWTIGSTVDDIGFTEALIDSLATSYNIDASRVFSTGMSNGGFMSFLLACQLSERIAAIASVTGSMTHETYINSNPQHPFPILQFHGTADEIVPYYGATWTKSIDDVLQYWVGYNNCNATPETVMLPDLDPDDGSTVEHLVYNNGNNGVTVEHYKITGGGHTWPGSAINLPGTNYDIDASIEIWNFFTKYDINGIIITSDIEPSGDNNPNLRIYPNPANSCINIEMESFELTYYVLFSPLGKKVVDGVITSNIHQVDISHLPPNTYFLKIGNSSFKIFKTK